MSNRVRTLVWLALGCSLGVALCRYLLPYDRLLWVAGVAAALGLAALFFRRRRSAWLAAALALLAAGVGIAWFWGFTELNVRPAEPLDGEERLVSVLVTDYPERYAEYSCVRVRITEDGLPNTTLLVYDYDDFMGALRPGELAELPLKLSSAGRKNGRESGDYYASGVFLRGTLTGAPLPVGRWRFAWLLFPKELAQVVKAQALQCFPGDVSGLMKALLTGDKVEYYLDESLSGAMQSAGFSHVVAVSGMHLGFLVSVLRLLFRRRRAVALVGLPVIVIFMAMIGFTPSVTRAGIMQILLLMAPLLGREEDGPTMLAAPLLLLLLINPWAVGSASLQFSFAAMAGLIAVSPRIFHALVYQGQERSPLPKGFRGAALRWLFASFASSVGALVFTTPLSALHAGSVPVYGVLTNLLCLWMMTLAFLGGFPVCLLGLIWPAVGSALGWLVAWLPRCAIWIVKLIARLPYAVLYTDGNLAGWWLVGVYLLFGLALLLRERFRPVIPICIALSSFALLTFCFHGPEQGALEVAVLDVGQGQSIVALTDGAVVMIDCGSADYGVDAGDAALRYLSSHGRRRVDLLVLTHFHGDHVNGVRRLLSRVSVRCLAYPADFQENDYSDAIFADCAAAGTELLPIDADCSVTLDGLDLRLYAPIGVGEVNEECLLVCGDWGEDEFLVTGDVSEKVERMFAHFYPLEDMEMMVAGHHGSRSSTCVDLLDTITPETVIVSCGLNNRYGHPAPALLERLAARNIAVYRTDLNGTVVWTAGG